ncbi:MAG: single-stranded-DNA-specific exonuclease RecJ [Clostridiales Family XIII bacterium]|jgi:single-stranded-DNA-specific exonuclease|nr:single-stranded-DNA-specific exonuclease RecJ [Clostridiales Family XIII bacterium]
MAGESAIVADLLRRRGIIEASDIEEFFSEKPRLTYDPFLLSHMEEGVDFILSAVNRQKKICVYGDYDADGIAAAALLVQGLSGLSEKLSWYIPSRFDEGYGLNKDALRRIADRGGEVVVTVDCGSVSREEVEYAKEIGLEILITDHHNTDENLPRCLLINPKKPGESYPWAFLSGCGVAFKLMQGVQRKLNLPKRVLTELLDLVAVATIGDIVPMLNENRTLTKYGLRAVNRGGRPGLARLIDKVGLRLGEITSENIAYLIVPHINAAGRMGDAGIVVELLLSDDAGRIEALADILCERNARRKQIQEEVFQRCRKIVEERCKDAPILVVNAGDAHEGIAGIVAGKLREYYGKPALILAESKGGRPERSYLKGSGRSIEGIDLHKLLSACKHMFEKFGGHEMACGFLMESEYEEEFREGVIRGMREIAASDPGIFDAGRRTDGVLTAGAFTKELLRDLSRLEPFGNENEEPVFTLEDVEIADVAFMGEQGQYARFQADGRLDCVFFGYAQEYKEILINGNSLHLDGSPSLDRWNGKERVRFLVKSIRSA